MARQPAVVKQPDLPHSVKIGILGWIERRWLDLLERWKTIRDLRFIAVLLLVGTALVVFVPQGKDVIGTLSDDWGGGDQRRWWYFLFSVAFLSFQVWMWSRCLIQIRYNSDGWRRDKFLVWAPRVLGLVPYIAAAFSLCLVEEGQNTLTQIAIVISLGAVSLVLYWQRYEIMAKLSSWEKARDLFDPPWRGLNLAPFEAHSLIVSLAISVVSIALFAADPLTIPKLIGPAALSYLAFALMIPAVSALMALFWRSHFPVLTSLFLLAVVFSATNDNHDVRVIKNAENITPTDRVSLKASLAQWMEQAPRDPDNPDEIPIVFVSSAGGASRAAFWTSEVLHRLDELDPSFRRSVFAISAVSGGALGSSDYVASSSLVPDDARLARELSRSHSGADHLAPALAGFFYTDAIQRFLPGPVLRDRSWSIERSFEAEWDIACETNSISPECPKLFERSFLDLYEIETAQWQPNLLLVGTLLEDGRRVITSNLDLVSRTEGESSTQLLPLLPNTYDHFELTQKPLRLSTAVMNSARFPWISPAGGLRSLEGAPIGHVIDGGYFEASAADTSFDLAIAVQAAAAQLCKEAGGTGCPVLKPVFLTLINSESETAKTSRVAGSNATPRIRSNAAGTRDIIPSAPAAKGANDLLAPLQGIFATQGGRADVTLARLARLNDIQAKVDGASSNGMMKLLPSNSLEVRLQPCRLSGERPLAMSWALSELTRDRVTRQVDGFAFDDDASGEVVIPECTRKQQLALSTLGRALPGKH